VLNRTDYGTGVEYDYDDQVGIDWVVTGGESGRNARAMHPDWARDLRDQCAVAGIPFLFKQWGEWVPTGAWGMGAPKPARLFIRPLRPRPEGVHEGFYMEIARLGKRNTGRLLDGVAHDAYPELVTA
jgi:hypothetical protein